MKLISHRGNIIGKNTFFENTPSYIINAINLGFDVEIDVWVIDNSIALGHDGPEAYIDISFLRKYKNRLWIHAKNFESLILLKDEFNTFFHTNEKYILTSHNFIWTYPSKTYDKNTIAVLPELFSCKKISHCVGICSDFIIKYCNFIYQ